MKTGALEGIRVLDLTRVLAGPYCCMVLADMGAEVIKVEMPDVGDEARTGPPFIKGESTYFHSFNRNKKGITLNLRKPEARKILLDLVKEADVVVENFTPGTMAEFGLSYDDLAAVNPRIIMASISGFGQNNSPYVKRVCYDLIAQAMGGLMSLTGYPDGPPTKVGSSIGDMTSGMFAAIGICGALYERTKSGKGQHIDVALVDSVFSLLEHAPLRYTATGVIPSRTGNRHPALTPFNSYNAKDGMVALGTSGNPVSFRLAEAIGRPDLITDPRYKDNMARLENLAYVESTINEWTSSRTTEEIFEIMNKYDVPCSTIYTLADIVSDPHFTQRGMLVDIEHPVAGTLKVVGPTIKFSRTPYEVTCAGPLLGQHNEEVYKGRLGMTDEEMKTLKEKKVI
jgi:CoA:oxalate CoA-transferase